MFAKVVALERVWGPGCLVEKQVCLTGSSGDTGVASQATGESINWPNLPKAHPFQPPLVELVAP